MRYDADLMPYQTPLNPLIFATRFTIVHMESGLRQSHISAIILLLQQKTTSDRRYSDASGEPCTSVNRAFLPSSVDPSCSEESKKNIQNNRTISLLIRPLVKFFATRLAFKRYYEGENSTGVKCKLILFSR